ncbi:MAG: AMP-binding protein [Actinomycetota bacterium]
MRLELRDPNLHPFRDYDIGRLIDDRGVARGGHPCLVWEPFEGDRRVWSYAEFADTVRRVAAGLQARGVGIGDRVLVHLDNCPESIFAWLGAAVAGASAVTTNARSVADELEYYAETAAVVGAITQPRFAELVQTAARPNFLIVTSTDNGAAAAAGNAPEAADSFDRLYEFEPMTPRSPDPNLNFSVQFTSGTTSRPKGVVWNHANALWGARMCARNEHLRSDDVHLTHLPLFHTNAQAYSVLASLWAGATIVAQPRFSASRFWDVSLRNGCTWASMVPFCTQALINRGEPIPDHSFRFFGMGAQVPALDEHFGVQTISWWGMTETLTQPIVSDPTVPTVAGAIGRPSPAYEIAVVGADGTPVDAGETGALRVRGIPGLSLFKEYLGNSTATEETFDDQGFMITGDLVTLLPSGDIQFADRDKDMLKVGGENVAASEIERVVRMVPGVGECAVVAKRDPMLNEIPVVFILPPEGMTVDPAALPERVIDLCSEKLADFKVPREVRIVDELPRSTLEKIAKNKLRDLVNADAGSDEPDRP